MALQLWLVDVLRKAGLPVHEVPGWRTRTEGSNDDERRRSAALFAPRGVIIHETRGSATSTDAGEIGVLVNGRVGLSGPIAQLYLSRSGEWWVVAAGLCHHVRTGWGGPFTGLGNSRLIGIEPAHAESESWAAKPTQYRSYVRGVAAILRHTSWPPPVGHKEHQPGDKPDPEFDMNRFRADVARAMAGGHMTTLDDGYRAADGNIRTYAQMIQNIFDHTFFSRWATAEGFPLAVQARLATLASTLAAVAAKVDIDPAELAAITAAITAAARAGAEAGVLGVADDLVAAILAGLPEGTLTRADVEAAIRTVLGGLDQAAGAG